jgi:hypothetical protein
MVPIVSRAQWGAAFTIPGGRHVAPSQRRWFVVHWPGSAVGGDERAVVRAIERHHRQAQGWQAAPGYNFLVGRSGTIYEGCGRDVRGIHSPPRNIDGWGVCVLISVGENPPQAALNATRALYNWLNGVAGRTLGMTWHGQHWATVCAGPGRGRGCEGAAGHSCRNQNLVDHRVTKPGHHGHYWLQMTACRPTRPQGVLSPPRRTAASITHSSEPQRPRVLESSGGGGRCVTVEGAAAVGTYCGGGSIGIKHQPPAPPVHGDEVMERAQQAAVGH